MNNSSSNPIPFPSSLAVVKSDSPAEAKARLLAWANQTDARSAKSRAGVGRLAAGGAMAALGLVAISRLTSRRKHGDGAIATGRRLITWALVARGVQWGLPLVLQAINASKRSRHQ